MEMNGSYSNGSGCPTDAALIKDAEGFRQYRYYDSVGVPTICYGQNLQNSGRRAEITALGKNFDAVMAGTQALSLSDCDRLLQSDLNIARAGVQRIYGNTVTCQCAHNVLVDMCYNLGEGGLSSFRTLKGYIQQENWQAAGNSLTTTLWYKQVGRRGPRNVAWIKTCPKLP